MFCENCSQKAVLTWEDFQAGEADPGRRLTGAAAGPPHLQKLAERGQCHTRIAICSRLAGNESGRPGSR